jgi:hypothetical protein
MINFTDITYLQNGNKIQQEAFKILSQIELFEILNNYNPVLAGTIPININIESSDLDIICECKNLKELKLHLILHFGHFDQFKITTKEIRGKLSLICKFEMEHFKFEIFAQDCPVKEQNAYKHMLIEYEILKTKGTTFRNQIIDLKRQGLKTEPAFAILLNLEGDPYDEVLKMNTKSI